LSRAIGSNFVVSNKQLDEPKNQHSKWLIGRLSSEVFSLCKKDSLLQLVLVRRPTEDLIV
jgi:hypothetical protein